MVQVDRDISPDFVRLKENADYIEQRRKDGKRAKIFSPRQEEAPEIASLIAAGGVVAMPWGAERRRIIILVGSFDNPLATGALNEIKGRPSRQVLGIGCLPEQAHLVAKIEESRPLVEASKRLLKIDQPTRSHLNQVLALLFENNSVGLLLKAQDSLPDEVTSPTPAGRSVMILGASDWQDPSDIYNNTLWELASRFGKVVAGTSANAHGKNVYSVASQHELYEALGSKVDGFVVFDQIPSHSPKVNEAASSTVLDLTEDEAQLMRWGSQHPFSFKRFFPHLIRSKQLSKEAHAEKIFGFLRRTLIK